MLECVGTLEYQAHHLTKSKQAFRIALALTLAVPQLTSASFTPLLSTNMTTNGETVSNHKELKLKDRGLRRPLDMYDHLRITANQNGNTANPQSGGSGPNQAQQVLTHVGRAARGLIKQGNAMLYLGQIHRYS